MRFQRKRLAITGGILAAFVLSVGVLVGITNKKENASAETGDNATIVIGDQIKSDNKYITNEFTLSIPGILDERRAWCGYGKNDSGATPGNMNNGGTVTRSWESYTVDENSDDTKKLIFKIMYYGELNDDYGDLAIHYALGAARGKGGSKNNLYDYALNAELPDRDNMTVYYTLPNPDREQYIYTYTSEEKKESMDLTIQKNWNDSINSEDYPSDLEIHVSVKRTDGGNPITNSGDDSDTIDLSDVVLNKANNWTLKYYNLKAGQEFAVQEKVSESGWTVVPESEIPADYTDTDTLYKNEKLKKENEDGSYTYKYYVLPNSISTNCQNSERESVCTVTNDEQVYENVSVYFYKHWEDDVRYRSQRPDKIHFRVGAFTGDNANPVEVTDMIDKIKNTKYYITAQSSNVWYGWISDLPSKLNGNQIFYAIQEVDVPANYSNSCQSGNTVTLEGGEYCLATEVEFGRREIHFTNKEIYTGLNVTKTWNDGGNDEKRPDMIRYYIYQNGEHYTSGVIYNPKSAGIDANVWVDTIRAEDKILPKYDKDGNEYSYTYEEFDFMKEWYDSDELSGNYFLSKADDGSMLNTAKTSIPVIKCFVDKDETKRPEELDFELFAGDDFVENLTLTSADENKESGCWERKFDNLPAYDDNGNEIIYRVEEDTSTMEGYELDEEFEVCTVNAGENFAADDENKKSCNFYNVQLVDIPVIKVWEEDSKEDRPGSIEVSLLCGDDVLDTVTLSEENNLDGDNTWEYTWKNRRVDECEQGYSVAENINIPGYSTKISGNAEDGFVITNTKTLDDILKWSGLGAGSFGIIAAGFLVIKRKLFAR